MATILSTLHLRGQVCWACFLERAWHPHRSHSGPSARSGLLRGLPGRLPFSTRSFPPAARRRHYMPSEKFVLIYLSIHLLLEY